MIAYGVAGIAAVVLVFLPFVLAAGPGMIRTVIFNQLGRSVVDQVSVLRRLRCDQIRRQIEGPNKYS